MNVLVTGAKGFIGTYLVKCLKKKGHIVYQHSHENGDLTDKDSLESYAGIDVIYHLAAKTYVPKSWEIPGIYINNNTAMLINVLEYCRENRTKLVFMSSYLYGEPEYLPIDEKHRCVALTPYHLCKKISEEICLFYSKNFDVDVVVVRPFNVYGKGQNKEFLLPKVYEQVMDATKDTIQVFTLVPKRDYIYVEDLAEVLVRLLPFIKGFDIFNVGVGKSYNVKEVIDIMQREFNTDKKIVEACTERKNEVMDCIADIKHLEKTVGKFRISSLSEGIHKWRIEDERQYDDYG